MSYGFGLAQRPAIWAFQLTGFSLMHIYVVGSRFVVAAIPCCESRTANADSPLTVFIADVCNVLDLGE